MHTFNIHAHNVGTTAFWRVYRTKAFGAKTWRGAMRKFAEQFGEAVCFRSDDSAFIITRDESRKSGFREETVKPANVRWTGIGF